MGVTEVEHLEAGQVLLHVLEVQFLDGVEAEVEDLEVYEVEVVVDGLDLVVA